MAGKFDAAAMRSMAAKLPSLETMNTPSRVKQAAIQVKGLIEMVKDELQTDLAALGTANRRGEPTGALREEVRADVAFLTTVRAYSERLPHSDVEADLDRIMDGETLQAIFGGGYEALSESARATVDRAFESATDDLQRTRTSPGSFDKEAIIQSARSLIALSQELVAAGLWTRTPLMP